MAFVKIYTTQTGDTAGSVSVPQVVDVAFPIITRNWTITGGGSSGNTTVEVKVTDAPNDYLLMDFGVTTSPKLENDQIVDNLNNIMGEAVAAPYAIPELKQVTVKAGYLEPDTAWLIQDLKYIAA